MCIKNTILSLDKTTSPKEITMKMVHKEIINQNFHFLSLTDNFLDIAYLFVCFQFWEI